MPKLAVGVENGHHIELHYGDHGAGPPVFSSTRSRSTRPLASIRNERFWRPDNGSRRTTDAVLAGQARHHAVSIPTPSLQTLVTLLTHLDLTGATLVGVGTGNGEVRWSDTSAPMGRPAWRRW
jgi:hypothetical protein